MSDRIVPCFCFGGQAEEAVTFYVGLLPGSAVTAVKRYETGDHFPAGTALLIEFTLAGRAFQAINGPWVAPSQASSLSIEADDQAEVDRLWAALTGDGGAEVACGWLTDRYGFAWQVVPRALMEMQRAGGPGVAPMMQAMMGMKKLDVAALEAAYRSVPADKAA